MDGRTHLFEEAIQIDVNSVAVVRVVERVFAVSIPEPEQVRRKGKVSFLLR
jgi:hypothetical protein